MVTLIEMMNEKVKGIGEVLDGYELSDRVNTYLGMCTQTTDYCKALMKQTEQHHLGFVPIINAIYMIDGGTDPRLWLLIYEDIMNDPEIDVPVEALPCAMLSVDDSRLKYKGVREMVNDDGEIEEWAYGFALAGVEEDWWEHDDLVTLPDREEGAIKAMAANAMMSGMMSEISEMMGGGDGPDEGWFA